MNSENRNQNQLRITNPSRPNRPRGTNKTLKELEKLENLERSKRAREPNTPKAFNQNSSHQNMVAALCGSYYFTQISTLSERERIWMINYILKKGIDIDINAPDDGDNTPLYNALYSHLNDVAEYLLGLEAAIDSRNEQQLTPLMGAILSGNLHGIDILFHQLPPPDLTLVDRKGLTALEIASNIEHSAKAKVDSKAEPDPEAIEKWMLAKEIRSYVEDRKERLDEQEGTTVYPNLEAYVPKGGSRLFNSKGTRKRTGIKYATAANARKSIKLLRGNPYKKRIASQMYYRAKFHKYQTPGMRDAMKVWKRYIDSL